jgi:hypothetical protein
MTLELLLDVLKKILVSPQVIGVTVVLAIYLNLVTYIVHYRKKPPAPKKPKKASGAGAVKKEAPPAAEAGEDEAEEKAPKPAKPAKASKAAPK